MSASSELRRRKLKDENGKPTSRRKRKEVQPSSIHRSLLCMIVSGTILTIFLVLYTDDIPWHMGHRVVDHVVTSFGYNKPKYAVVIDAGSTGSRVFAFTFHESYFGAHLMLDNELFVEVKPGLSSYADEPEKGAESIKTLLKKAEAEIPKQFWTETPLVLKATAGLRLLPSNHAENLLIAVRKLFKNSPFKTDDNSVSIMDGSDEGIFAWFTINFLIGSIYSSPTKTVAALDLGGGSTQITFAALTPSSLSQKQFIHYANTPNRKIPVYTHSYLGLGLMATRKEIITADYAEDVTTVTSECVNPIVRDHRFKYGGVDYLVSGLQENYSYILAKGSQYALEEKIPIVDFDKCSSIVRAYVKLKASPPDELTTKTVFAFSYYFDRATDAGLIEFPGGQLTVGQYMQAAKRACNNPNADQPFLCLDLTFIWVLLEEGLGLDSSTTIYLYKSVKGHEVSWSLGAAWDILNVN